MQKLNRPFGDIQEAAGRITAAWNVYFTGVESAVFTPLSGITSERPTQGLTVGDSYYSTTLNMPIYVSSLSPTVWRDSAGVVVP